jgi:hypothetical protein
MKAKVKTWIANVENGNIKSKTEIVLNYIKMKTESGFSSDVYHMRTNLMMAHQTLTGVMSLLADEGLIDDVGQIEFHGQHYSLWKYVTNEDKRKIIAHDRKVDKFNQWVKKGVEDYSDMISDNALRELHEINELNAAIRRINNQIDKNSVTFNN